LTRKVRKVIADATTEVHVSAASAWEIAIKVRLGKLVWPVTAGSVSAYVFAQGFRMLIAQAHAEQLWLASNDTIFDAAGVRRYW
jgi:PIN domain nuclease of toxin-antitoxin system